MQPPRSYQRDNAQVDTSGRVHLLFGLFRASEVSACAPCAHMPRAPMAVVLVGNESYERDRGESEPYARSTCEA